MNRNLLSIATLIAFAPIAVAQNDECATALPLVLDTPTPFDTTLATLSTEAWGCAFSVAPDLWYSVQFPANGLVTVDTCGSLYDTALEIYDGTCGSLTPIDCNDDACSTQSSITFTATAGTTYLVRVGGWQSSSGAGTIVATQPSNVTNDECATAIVLTVDVPESFDTTTATLSTPPWTCATSTAPDVWYTYTALADGTIDVATCGSLYDTALEVFDGACDTSIALDCNDDSCGTQSELSFAGIAGTTYLIRVGGFGTAFGSGEVLVTETPNPPMNIGTNYCVAVPNSTGQTGEISAVGSEDVADNDVTLMATQLPNNSFGYFLNSQTQGLIVNPGNSMGTLCLDGEIGRYVGTNEVQDSGTTGSFELQLDLTMTPTPTGFVAIMPGETWNFQVWHRDLVGGIATSNFTDAISITFQ